MAFDKVDENSNRPAAPASVRTKFNSPRRGRPILIGVVIWALLPWLFALVYAFHPFDHADPFWLPALPLVMVSTLPMLVVGQDVHGFPLPWVALSSVFNLTAGLLVAGVIAAIRGRRQSEDTS